MVLIAPGGDAKARLDVAQKNMTSAIIVEGKILAEAEREEEKYRKARKQIADVRSRLAKAKDHVVRCKNELCIAQHEWESQSWSDKKKNMSKNVPESKHKEMVKKNLFDDDKEKGGDEGSVELFDDSEVSDDMLSQIDMEKFKE